MSILPLYENTGMPSMTTTILISNLHCSSCVNTIRETLYALTPSPISIHTSIVSQSVSVEHDQSLSADTIKDALEEAGFDLITTPQFERYALASLPRREKFLLGEWKIKKKEKHAEQCLLCRQEASGEQRGENTAETLVNSPDPDLVLSRVDTLHLDNVLPTRKQYPDATFGDVGPYNALFSVGGMTCASCVSNVTYATTDIPGATNVAVNLINKSATATLYSKEAISKFIAAVEDGGYECELISLEPVKPLIEHGLETHPKSRTQKRGIQLQATFSVGGMTCASCVGNVTRAVEEIQGVSNVGVSLVGKSATMTVESEDLVKDIVNAIEEGGYEVELVNIEPIVDESVANNEDSISASRTVSLRVDGMFCHHCPDKIRTALSKPSFGSNINIEALPSYPSPRPILTVTYTPSCPSLTLRHIISAVAQAKSPPFVVSISNPPSLEGRARILHAREQWALLLRLLSATILAIPTFILGIVFMTLVPTTNPTRQWIMEPIWAGNASRAQWALLLLATPAMFYSAGPFHRRSLKEIYGLWRPGSRVPFWRRFVRFGSMNLLVSMGVSIAYFASIALLVLASLQSRDPNGEGNTTTYFDSVVFLSMFLLSGRWLEAYSKSRTADAITALGKLRPMEAFLLVPTKEAIFMGIPEEFMCTNTEVDVEKAAGLEEELQAKSNMRIQKISAEFLEIGDIVRVPHGASPPADAIIVSPQTGAQFDESSLTGESRPITKHPGEVVYVGTINRGQVVDVRVTKLGGETMLDQIVKVVREGQTKRAPIERVADLVTGYFVPVITFLAVSTWIIWLALGESGVLPSSYLDIPVGSWPVWALEFAIAVFVVACPCGVGLAAPTALLVGSGLAAKFGILVRGGGEAFQEAAQLDLVVFDKTGTLTEGGEPRVTDANLFAESNTPTQKQWNREKILSVVHEIESSSSHPLSVAIRSYCEAQEDIQLSATSAETIEEAGGRGLKATFASPGCVAIIGNERWIEEHGAIIDDTHESLLDKWKSEGKSIVLCAFRDTSVSESVYTIVALFAVSDSLRAEARSVVHALQSQGLRTWMISGDNKKTATAVAGMVGIPEANVIAGVLPHEKAAKVAWLQQVGTKRPSGWWRRWLKPLNERCIVAFVGDGINDAPALTTADVGIAIGSGSDVAISSASFILIKSNLRSILTLTDLSRRVFTRVKFNFFWAFMYNIAALPIAAGVIYPAGHARLDPVWASLAMALSSVTVVTSSLLLRLYQEPKIQNINMEK